MKHITLKLSVAALSLVVFACGSKPSGILEKMQAAGVSTVDEMGKYYTKETVEAMKELNALAPRTEKGEATADKKFVKGARWKVVEEKIDGDKATVKIKYTEHPVENMKGLEMTWRMKKEDGQWKIDMEKELRDSITMIKAMNKSMGGLLDQMKKMMK